MSDPNKDPNLDPFKELQKRLDEMKKAENECPRCHPKVCPTCGRPYNTQPERYYAPYWLNPFARPYQPFVSPATPAHWPTTTNEYFGHQQ